MNWTDKYSISCPQATPVFTAEQLDHLKHAIYHSILTTAHAFYDYQQDRTKVPQHMQYLFDQYSGDQNDWSDIQKIFKSQDSTDFNKSLKIFTSALVQDPRIALYCTDKDTYWLLLPLATIKSADTKQIKFYKACLQLFCYTRLAEAEDRMPKEFKLLGEGKRAHLPLENNPSIQLEFETANSLYSFIKLLGPAAKHSMKFEEKIGSALH